MEAHEVFRPFGQGGYEDAVEILEVGAGGGVDEVTDLRGAGGQVATDGNLVAELPEDPLLLVEEDLAVVATGQRLDGGVELHALEVLGEVLFLAGCRQQQQTHDAQPLG